MRREDLSAAARFALRPFSALRSRREDETIPVGAIIALAFGLLLAAALLAATQPKPASLAEDADAARSRLLENDTVVAPANHSASAMSWLAAPAFGALEVESFEVEGDLDFSDEFDFTSDSPAGVDGIETRWFNNRPIRPVTTVTMRVTAYSPDEQSCGIWADGITASGYSVWTNGMKLVAADTSILPFGSLVSVPGYDQGAVVPVLDRGGAIKGHRLDVLYPTHERALEWGVQDLEITIWEYADGKPNGFRQNHRRR